MSSLKLSLHELNFSFGTNIQIFKGFSLEFGSESPVMILGPSGCGKTTLLKLIAGLLKPDTGEIAANFDQVSMVFQEPRLLPWKTLIENISLPLLCRMEKKVALETARYYLELVSLNEFPNAFPDEISVGQKQRVNLARAFACPGDLMLMDEPFQSLDIPLRIELMDLTKHLLEISTVRHNKTPLLIIVTHDPREAVYMGKRIIILGERLKGIIFDEKTDFSPEEREYGSIVQGKMERKILNILSS